MSIVSVVLGLAIFAFIVWLVLQIPMPPVFQKVIIGIMCFFLVIWVLQLLGVSTGLPTITLR